MAKSALYLIFIRGKKDESFDSIKETMDLSNDWFRLNSTCWVVYTTSDADRWYSRLSDHVKPDGSVFITRIDPSDNTGWMTKRFWDWFEPKAKKIKESEA
jgi:hypothetical protein